MFKNRHMISKKEKKKIIGMLREILGCNIDGEIEVAEYENMKILFINGKIRGFIIGSTPFLNVEGLKEYGAKKRYVVVDEGAIKPILNGAAVMAAGIIDCDEEIKENDLVWVRDERGLPLAIGRALMDGKKMREEKHGKAVETMHRIGDKIWKMATG